MVVDGPLEGHDQTGGFGQVGPAPGVELLFAMGLEIDLGVPSEKTVGEPHLLLADIPTPLQRAVQDFGRKVIGNPVGGAAQQFDRADTGFLEQFAPGGGLEVLVLVDTALGKLPVPRVRRADPAAQPDAALGIEDHDADVGAVKGEVALAHRA